MENGIKKIGSGLKFFGIAVILVLTLAAVATGEFALMGGLLAVLFLISIV